MSSAGLLGCRLEAGAASGLRRMPRQAWAGRAPIHRAFAQLPAVALTGLLWEPNRRVPKAETRPPAGAAAAVGEVLPLLCAASRTAPHTALPWTHGPRRPSLAWLMVAAPAPDHGARPLASWVSW